MRHTLCFLVLCIILIRTRHHFDDHVHHKHDTPGPIMYSTRSVSVALAVLVAAILTALLVLYRQSPDPLPVTSCHHDDEKTDSQPLPPATPALRPRLTFLQRMKDTDLSDIMPLYPSGPLLISEVDSFNNRKIAPRLQSIVAMDYFRFVKLNLSKKCSLWADDARCAERSVCAFCYGHEVG